MTSSTKVNCKSIVNSFYNPYNEAEVVVVKEINIGRAIVQGRRAKGITQEELAQYMGVSKASVSKWELGHSYPDITFLPQLAAYFNVSIDELMGYEPQMAKEDIRKLYFALSQEFGEQSFGEVMERCEGIIRQYFSCFPLLLQMGILLLNHVHLAPSPEDEGRIYTQVREICRRIKAESGDVALSRQANMIEALCELNLGNPAPVIDLLDGVNDPVLGEEVILASAHYYLGHVEEAKETTQVGIFRHLVGILADIPNYLMLNVDDAQKYNQIVERTLGLIELFAVDRLHPAMLFGIYLTAAQGYAALRDQDQALDMLERYVDLVVSAKYPIEFTGDEFFDRVENWFKELDLGPNPPRSEAVLQDTLLESVTKNPAFAEFHHDARFQSLTARLAAHFSRKR